MLLDLGILNSYVMLPTLLFTLGLLYIEKRRKRRKIPSTSYGILITGCDYGLGYSLARHCNFIGLTVFAGCLDDKGPGACSLRSLQKVRVIKLDVTDLSSISEAYNMIHGDIGRNKLELYGVVNNAGVMVFGEFPWYTNDMIENQISVNLIGAMNVTKQFSFLIRKYKGRIINVTSHCASEALPGLSVYAASKAGLQAWSNAIRVEYRKYGIHVINFIPGSFYLDTNIMCRQSTHSEKMKNEMSVQQWILDKEYFSRYNEYLEHIPKPPTLNLIKDRNFYDYFEDALLSHHPNHLYCYSPWRYFIYYNLFKITPVFVRDYLVLKFMRMPQLREP